jgi:hypothetical protein
MHLIPLLLAPYIVNMLAGTAKLLLMLLQMLERTELVAVEGHAVRSKHTVQLSSHAQHL